MFGMRVTLLYNVLGIAVAVVGGMLINGLGMEKYIAPEFLNSKRRKQFGAAQNDAKPAFRQLIGFFWEDGMVITKQVFPYVVLGVAVGGFIHGFVPSSLVEGTLAAKTWWSIPVATILGAPLYANSVSVIPIMEALVGKGVPLGTALAFMTGIVTISIPEGLILKKVMGWPLLGLFFGITISGIMLMGYLFNSIL